MTTGSGEPRLGGARLVAYALPTLALQSMMVPLLLYLPPAYASVTVGMALSVVGAMFLVGRVFELFSDPLIGALSDRTRSRFGRRRPWMLIGLPIAVVAGWFLVSPPAGASAAYLGVWLIILYLGWTMIYIPHQSWGGEITNDYQERTRIAGYRETGAFVGYLLASLVPLIYWKFIMGVEAPSFEQIVRVIGIFFAVALPVGVIACLLFVPQGVARTDEQAPSWRELYAILARNRPFLRLGGSYLFDRLAMGTYFAAQPFFVAMVLDLQKDVLTVGLTNTIVAALLAPSWVGIARRLGKHRSYVLANVITAGSYLLLFFAPVGALGVVLAAQVLMGFGNGGTMITPPAMAADTVDHDELHSGVRQMGGHMAFLAIVFKGGIMLGAPLTLGLIAMFGYEGGAQVLDSPSAFGIRICASLLPAALLSVPMIFMWRFPIDAARHSEIRAALEQRAAG
ncbi:MAG: MFS transporter [Pseudomonadales bacterium]|nr:MFS transporter [Pseudomonadales bacterium]